MRTVRVILGCLVVMGLVWSSVALAEQATKPAAKPKATAGGTAKSPAVAPKTTAPAAMPKAPAVSPTPLPPLPSTEPGAMTPPAEPLPPTLPPMAPPTPKAPAATPPGAIPPGATPATEPPPVAPPVTTTTPAVAPEGPAETGPKTPYSGFANADLVNVRSGPGLYYYPLASLPKNTEVTVEGESGGWAAVRPTSGVCGLMKKTELTLGPGGTSATVSSATARVYASSGTAKRHWSVMNILKQGDPVKVIGPAQDDMVRVTPPEGSRVYIVAQYVTPGAATTATQGTSQTAQIARMEIPEAKPDPLVGEFKKADADLKAEMAKPVESRNYMASRARYQEIAEKAEKAYLRQAARERLAYVDAMSEQRDDLLKVMSIGENLNRRMADLKAKEAATVADSKRDKAALRPEFLATGVVAKLESLEDVDYPIKYKLIDDKGHPLYVLKSTAFDLGKYVGKVVGIRGAKTYLKDWRIYLVTIDEIEVLE